MRSHEVDRAVERFFFGQKNLEKFCRLFYDRAEEKAAKFSSRGYRPAPLFERTPPSAVTSRRPPGCWGKIITYTVL